jgi:hypothetical protein
MKWFGYVFVLVIFTTNSVFAQNHKVDSKKQRISFFMERAQQDAKYEQTLVTGNKEDELDIWKDQKRFEKDLKDWDWASYDAYMFAKKNAYLKHDEVCEDHCNHTDYYFEQITPYLMYQPYDYHKQKISLGTEVYNRTLSEWQVKIK